MGHKFYNSVVLNKTVTKRPIEGRETPEDIGRWSLKFIGNNFKIIKSKNCCKIEITIHFITNYSII